MTTDVPDRAPRHLPEGSGLVPSADGRARCSWCDGADDYRAYHDLEWGRPVVDDVRLYEKVCLEGFQSGLAWITILRKRDAFRRAFGGFVPEVVAGFDADDVERLVLDAGIVRHRGKIQAAIANARATLEVQRSHGSLAAFVWSFAPDHADRPAPRSIGDLPARTPESDALSTALRRAGFRFVGPTTAYAAMQSLGLVNDHVLGCWARDECERERRTVVVPRGTGSLDAVQEPDRQG